MILIINFYCGSDLIIVTKIKVSLQVKGIHL